MVTIDVAIFAVRRTRSLGSGTAVGVNRNAAAIGISVGRVGLEAIVVARSAGDRRVGGWAEPTGVAGAGGRGAGCMGVGYILKKLSFLTSQRYRCILTERNKMFGWECCLHGCPLCH